MVKGKLKKYIEIRGTQLKKYLEEVYRCKFYITKEEEIKVGI